MLLVCMFPRTYNPAVVRTDFDNQNVSNAVCSLIRAPVQDHGDTFYASVDFVKPSEYWDLSVAELLLPALPT